MSETRRRVKLYILNEQRLWDDRGTGHVSSAYVERLKGVSLIVRSESDGILILESKIQPDTAYQKQQETLIVWSEQDYCDLALSFQEKAGCDEIWEMICQVQGKDPSVSMTQEYIDAEDDLDDHDDHDDHDVNDDRYEDLQEDKSLELQAKSMVVIELPPCELSKLDDILLLLTTALTSTEATTRNNLSTAIEKENYIPQLLQLFRMCEDLESIHDLHKLYEIFKSLFLLNRNPLLEIMFQDEYIFDVLGALEYDPFAPKRIKHREFLRNKSVFKEVIPFNNPDLVQKIHQTYRVQYIQDVILPTPSVFEENVPTIAFKSFIFYNKLEIVNMIQDDEKSLRQLFAQVVDDETDDSRRRDLVMFLREFVSFAQSMENRDSILKTLSCVGILGTLEVILALDGEELKSAAVDILIYLVQYCPAIVREYIVSQGQKQEDEDLMINLVIEQMINDTDPELGGAVQLAGLIKMLIDPETMIPGVSAIPSFPRSEFLSFFYKHSMHVLTAPLLANTVDNKPSKDDFQTAQLLSQILELLTFCIEHHGFYIRNYILNKDLLRRVLVLLKSKHAFLALCALRVMRKLLSTKDDLYYRYTLRGELFKPVVEAFQANGNRYNLFNSALIELFEFIRVEDNELVIVHVVENYYKYFEDVDYVQTFKKLKNRYDELQNALNKLGDDGYKLRRRGIIPMDEDELYFDEEDLEEEEPEPEDAILDAADAADRAFDLAEENRKAKEADQKDFTLMGEGAKLIMVKRGTINIQLHKSPPGSGSPTPSSTPASSPTNSPSANSPGLRAPFSSPTDDEKAASQPFAKKLGLVGGLVDYDEDSDEEVEEEEDSMPSSKRLRLST